MKKRIAVMGAGPMGLALAYFLREWATPVVFEADKQPGGMSASIDFDGTIIEKYYHFINLPDHSLFSLLHELDMYDDLRWVPTAMGFYRKGLNGGAKLHDWGNPVALLKLGDISFRSRFRYGLHVFYCKFIKNLTKLDDVSAADWFRQWEGDDGYDKFWRFLFEKKFFELADPLSAAWIASRIRRVANSRKSLMQEMLGYLEGGSVSLINRLCEEIRNAGGEIRLGSPANHVDLDPAKEGGIVYSGGEGEYFDAVASTMPLPYLPSVIPDLPTTYLDAVSEINNIACACALFRLGKPLTRNFWLNVDIPEWDIPGIIEYSNLRPMEKTHVYIPFYMPHAHSNWQGSDFSMLDKAREYLRDINGPAAASEEAARVFRYEYAQPVCTPGFRNILPPYETGARGILSADTTHSFPEDRSINESVRIAAELAEHLKNMTV